MGITEMFQCGGLGVILAVGAKLLHHVYNKLCPECWHFGLQSDTRRYRVQDEDVDVVDTIVFCPSCGAVTEQHAHVVGEDES